MVEEVKKAIRAKVLESYRNGQQAGPRRVTAAALAASDPGRTGILKALEVAMLAFQFVAILAATFFSGAAIYINLAEHPARMECGTQLAVTVFGPSYQRAAVMQIILALAATIAGISAWFLGAPRLWFVGAVLIFAVIPFTLIAIMPTNKTSIRVSIRTSEVAHQLLQDWEKLHAVRSLLALGASVAFLSSVIWR